MVEPDRTSAKRRRQTRYTPLPGIMENAVYLAPTECVAANATHLIARITTQRIEIEDPKTYRERMTLIVFETLLLLFVEASTGTLYHAFTPPDCSDESRTVFVPKTSDTDDFGRIIRSPDGLRPLTLCNCDCKLLTSAICRGLHWYTMRCNIFEIETTALAHVACAPQESGVLLTDFAAAYPSVNHSWIFSVLENTGLPDFLCRFVRSIYSDSITHVEFAGAERGQFLMARGVRQGCPASGFLFAMALTRSSDGSKNLLSQGTSTMWSSYSLHNVLTPMISLLLLHPFEI